MLEDSASSYQQVLGLLFGLHLGLRYHESVFVLLDIIQLEPPSIAIVLLLFSMGRFKLGSSCSCPCLLLFVDLLTLSMCLCFSITSLGAFRSVATARNALALMIAVISIKIVAADVIDF